MKRLLFSSAFIMTIALLAACSDDDSSNFTGSDSGASSSTEDIMSVATREKLPTCTMKHNGTVRMVEDEESLYICSNEEWMKYDPSDDEKSDDAFSSSSWSHSESSMESDDEESSSSSDVIASSSSAKQSSSSSAESSSGTQSSSSIAYGTLTDTRDGQTYKTVTIGTQTWMAENLNYDYNEGSAESYCYYNNPNICDTDGRLYLWSAAMDSAQVFSTSGEGCGYGKTCSASGTIRGVCPEGWHLPSYGEFETLINYVDPSFGYGHTGNDTSSTAGYYLKATSGWNNGGNGKDTYGFSAIPAGRNRADTKDFYGGDFYGGGNYAFFWSSTEFNNGFAYHFSMCYYDVDAGLYRDGKDYARSVRCLKD